MNQKVIVTQVKREFWENKVSFIYTPLIITALILFAVIFGGIYANGKIEGHEGHFSYSSGSVPTVPDAASTDKAAHGDAQPDDSGKRVEKFDLVTSVAKDPGVLGEMVKAIMYANCGILSLCFSIVFMAYALRCLFDDRKNKDILFWRSMPVSETLNVLVKLGILILVAPTITLILNYIVTIAVSLVGLSILAAHGANLGLVLSAAFSSQTYYIPFQIFYEVIFASLMLMPVFGFALFSSAFAKKTPFFTFASPILLALADKILNYFFGLNIGVIDFFEIYWRALANTSDAFMLQHVFVFNHTMILPLISCIVVGALFVTGAIWLRNNRYEI